MTLSAGSAQWRVLAGPAGSGKTAVLRALANRGEQILDLEGLARHRGSAFGDLGITQPTHREFATAVHRVLRGADRKRILWVEHEARFIGRVGVPLDVQACLAQAPALLLAVSRGQRKARLIAEYGDASPATIIAGVRRIANRLPPARAEELRVELECGQPERVVDILLDYYDPLYADQLSQRTGPVLATIDVGTFSPEEIATQLTDI